MPFAIFTHSDTEPARVLYSHLTEETAIEVVDRINTKLYERGLPAGAYYEEHSTDAKF